MKNITITPHTLVPREIRLEVYKKSLELLQGDELVLIDTVGMTKDQAGLCLLLPCALWGINVREKAPNGKHWAWRETRNMFPELTPKDIDFIVFKCNGVGAVTRARIAWLERTIASMTFQTSKPRAWKEKLFSYICFNKKK